MIGRDVSAATDQEFDLIVVGGGIYGAALVLEASRRGLAALLVEREDFGHATSHKSLRIVHGGLRYLQSLDLGRFRDSVRERSWFLEQFADLVEPLPCLMPLYGKGLRRPAVLKTVLWLNDFLSRRRNEQLAEGRRLPNGRLLDVAETVRRFPAVDREGLRGGAVWHDAVMRNSQRIVIEMLHWACGLGAQVLNYTEAQRPVLSGGAIAGLAAHDRASGHTVAFRAPRIVNCAGPWCREVGGRWDRDVERLFRPSLAFNLLLDRRALSSSAVAVTPKQKHGRTYFLVPWQGRILAGTYHAPQTEISTASEPHPEQVENFLTDLNLAIPDLGLTRADVLRIDCGLLPAAANNSAKTATRPVILDHVRHGGPAGLYSVSGVKFTTARLVAERTLQRIHGRRIPSYRPNSERPAANIQIDIQSANLLFDRPSTDTAAALQRLVATESVLCMDDLLLRRTGWGDNPGDLQRLAKRVDELLGPQCTLNRSLGNDDPPTADAHSVCVDETEQTQPLSFSASR